MYVCPSILYIAPPKSYILYVNTIHGIILIFWQLYNLDLIQKNATHNVSLIF